ncbi:hypothetical protein PLICRDRAFT_163283 [Plicaturopsis crispa FD-325 SS-3]|nr:hypothetical protein PLICRDRAFT_163283 [Plicaturopsis crispa FD-325 SS-3]
MPEGMPPWKPFASAAHSRLHSVRDFLSQRDLRGALPARRELQPGEAGYIDGVSTPQRETWSKWAGQKIKRGQGSDSAKVGRDNIMLFPGWAARRYRASATGEIEEAFDVDVFVSGFASSRRPPELATRSQRAFLRLAKGFASLPKLPSPTDGSNNYPEQPPPPALSRSTEDLLSSIHLPPRPEEISEDYEIEALEKQFRRAEVSTQHIDPSTARDIDTESSSSSASSSPTSSRAPSIASSAGSAYFPTIPGPPTGLGADIRRLHANLESRLQPFWSSALSARVIRLSLFASPHEPSSVPVDEEALIQGPVATQDVLTGADGSFQVKFTVSWETLGQHPGALHIAFGDPTLEHEMLVSAELLPSSPGSAPPPSLFHAPAQPVQSTLHISLTHSDVRVISDIDDTVKLSNILSGARAVFHNVFVKEFSDIVIPGMGEWYTNMWHRGVRFHYVSNGPFELLPVVMEFFNVSRLPPGSVKLKSYAGRSLFNGLLSAPATRKRAGIEDILDAFPTSRFLCVGDTGEQDLELYAAFAAERPQQVLAVFVRDANTYDDGEGGVQDPTGFKKLDGFFAPMEHAPPGSYATPQRTPQQQVRQEYGDVDRTPVVRQTRAMSDVPPRSTPMRQLSRLSIPPLSSDYFSSGSSRASGESSSRMSGAFTDEPGSFVNGGGISRASTPGGRQALSESEKKRSDLQTRIHRARMQMPAHIPLRIFRRPEECVEAGQILDKLHIGSG